MKTVNVIEEKYTADLKYLPPGKRLQIGMELGDLVLEIARSGIRSKNPNITPAEMGKELKRRINLKG